MSAPPISIPTSTPLDPSKLNQQPAQLPPAAESNAPKPQATSPPLRSAQPDSTSSSSYLDSSSSSSSSASGGAENPETPSHPTVAETGLARSVSGDGVGPGPKSGQLRRVPGGEKAEKEIIPLGSFGGDGLKAKPPPPVGVQPKSPEVQTFSV